MRNLKTQTITVESQTSSSVEFYGVAEFLIALEYTLNKYKVSQIRYLCTKKDLLRYYYGLLYCRMALQTVSAGIHAREEKLCASRNELELSMKDRFWGRIASTTLHYKSFLSLGSGDSCWLAHLTDEKAVAIVEKETTMERDFLGLLRPSSFSRAIQQDAMGASVNAALQRS